MKNPLRKYSETDVEVENTEEVQEDTEMVEKKHSILKKVLIGAAALLGTAAVAGVVAANRSSDGYDQDALNVDGTSDDAVSAANDAE